MTSNTSLLKKTTSQSRDLRHNCGNTLFVCDLERTLEHSQQQARQTEMGHNYLNYRMDSVGLWNYSIELALKQILIFQTQKLNGIALKCPKVYCSVPRIPSIQELS